MKLARLLSRRTLALVAAVIVLGAIALEVRAYQEFRRDLSRYRMVELEMPRAEVVYRLGPPKLVLAAKDTEPGGFPGRRAFNVNGPAGDQNTLPASRAVNDYPGWVYDADDHGADLTLDFDERGVARITCTDFGDNPFSCGPFAGGVWAHQTERTIVARLGKPTRSSIDGGVKEMCFDDLGLCVLLQKQKAYMLWLEGAKGDELAILRRFVASQLP